jgi:bifunctional non-homologous end joining protein LigD
MGLTEYKKKRDFGKTAEPAGKPLPKAVKGATRFVIQKHDASRLHYDFRLEMDGVLKSWAVPKGLPWKQGEKHLAVEVEDHPVEYATFEGIIPEGQYGGGTVMLWDQGKYYVYGEKPLESLAKGRLHLVLDGKKAKGEWALIRIRSDGAKNQWLLLKATKSLKPISKKLDDQSVKSGRTMKQIAAKRDAEWQSNRSDESPASSFKSRVRAAIASGSRSKEKASGPAHKKKVRGQNLKPARGVKSNRGNGGSAAPSGDGKTNSSGAAQAVSKQLDSILKELPRAKPRFIEPMKARLVTEPPKAGDWLYELKFDGFRAIAVKDGDKVNLISRNKNELRSRFPEIAEAMKEFPAEECVIDGEIVALDEEGRSSFQLLQGIEMDGHKSPIRFYVFDILQLNGRDLKGLPLASRKEVLAALCQNVSEPTRYSGEVQGNVQSLLKEVQRRGLEGIIGKLRESKYEAGRRSGTWIKLKVLHEQEFVIGGYTPPAGARKYFGAILVGYYANTAKSGGKERDSRLLFAGKVGTGFDSKSLAGLAKQFRSEERDTCPFADLPSKQGGQWVQGITPSMMKKMHWINPKFVAQIKFGEWTRDGKLRQPVYLGLREDKDPKDVIRES